MLSNLTCKPGSYIEVVPLGLQCTLQYNANGILQKILIGFHTTDYANSDVKVLDPDLTLRLMKAKKVPHRIPFSLGTTWVKAIFYTKKHFKTSGLLPECLYDDLIEDLVINMEDYTLYACDLCNDSFTFLGGPIIATRLNTFGFETLPGYQVYDMVSSIPLKSLMQQKKSPFEYPYVSGIFTYEAGKNATYLRADLYQATVKSMKEYLEEHGYLRASLKTDLKNIDAPYSDIAKYNVGNKASVILDEDKILASWRPKSLINNKVSRTKECSICHHKMIVPPHGNTHCENEKCPSRLYSQISHFLKVLNLPSIEFDEYQTLIRDKSVGCLLDLFSLEKFEGVKVQCTLSNFLFAVVPFELCRGLDFFQQFTNYLGSIEAFDFYLENPDAISSDLRLNKMYSKNFSTWLKDPEHLLIVRTLLDMKDVIEIQPVKKHFEGAPIFRGKTICLTGKFQHGTLEDVIGILQSYSAKVTTNFDNTVNCVVIGHYECEDKDLIETAVSYHVPIYGEDDFFKAYEIDLDIEQGGQQ